MSRPDLSRRALEKLAQGAPLDAGERVHVEAIIIPGWRPAIDVIGGDFTTRHADWLHLVDEPAHGVLRAAFGCVGRIDIVGHPTLT